MTEWSLKKMFTQLNNNICQRLETARYGLAHPDAKGDASECVWLDIFNTYLPKRYQTTKGYVVDSNGVFSHQIDVIVYDAQYSPLILQYEGQIIVPAESVYAVFEAKQTLNAENIKYARQKVNSVRQLDRTSLPIPHAGGTYPKKPLIPICGGLLTLDSSWDDVLGKTLLKHLDDGKDCDRLDIGCVASHGYFKLNKEKYDIHTKGKPATAFLFALISQLQSSATVSMIDIQKYARWLD